MTILNDSIGAMKPKEKCYGFVFDALHKLTPDQEIEDVHCITPWSIMQPIACYHLCPYHPNNGAWLGKIVKKW